MTSGHPSRRGARASRAVIERAPEPVLETSWKRWARTAGQRVSQHPAIGVALLAAIGALVLTLPVVLNPTTMIYGAPGDATGTVAIFWWWSYALRNGQSLFDNVLVGAPLGSGWNTIPFDPLQVVVFAPLSYLISPTAAYNVGYLASYPLTAFTTFLLARRLGQSTLGAVFAGLAFAFIPFHTEKAQGHLMQTHMEVFPAFLLFMVRWWQGGSRWNVVIAGVVAGLTMWTDAYLAYTLAVVGLAFFGVTLVLPRAKSRAIGHRALQHVVAIGLLVSIVALFLPIEIAVAVRSSAALDQATAAQASTLHRTLEDVRAFSARPWEYVWPWYANPVIPSQLRALELGHLHGSNVTEQTVLLGYTVLTLAAVGVAWVRHRQAVVLCFVIAAAGFVMSMPPSERLGPVTVYFPSYALLSLLPVFRVYSRFAMLVMLATALVAGIGLTRLQSWSRLPSAGWRRSALLFVPFVLMAVEFNNMPPTHVFAISPAPAAYTWLRDKPDGILIEYPLAVGPPRDMEIQSRQYTLYQQYHLHPLFNGGSSSSPATKLAPSLEPYYKPGVVSQLRQLGIRYVFVHRTDYIADGLHVPLDVAGLRYLGAFGDTDIFMVMDSL